MFSSEPPPVLLVKFALSFALLDPQQYFRHAHS
jgi:hypothetical protein